MGVETAIIAGAVIGAGATYMASEKSSKAQKKAAQLQAQASAQQLAFAREQFEYFKDIFGDTEQNLKQFYNSLDEGTFKALGLQAVESEFARAEKNLQRTLAARGLLRSGIEAKQRQNLEFAKALARAKTKVEAPFKLADEKMKFMGIGRGLVTQSQQNVLGALGQQAAMYGQQAAMYGQQAAMGQQAFAQSMSGLGQTLGYIYGQKLLAQQTQPPAAQTPPPPEESWAFYQSMMSSGLK